MRAVDARQLRDDLDRQAAHIGSAIDRAQAAYDRIASTAELVLPFLSPERSARALGDVAGGTRSTGSAVCSNGSGATGGVEAGRGRNSHNQGDVRELIWDASRQGGALGKLNLPRQLSDKLNQNDMQCRDECV